jgi:hypothetical protein
MIEPPKLNPEGHELAAKIWNERYIELSKSAARDYEKHVKHVEQLAAEIQGYHALLTAAQAVLKYAEENLTWRPIESAPWREDEDNEYDYRSPDSGEGIGQVYQTDMFDDDEGSWLPDLHVGDVLYKKIDGVVSRATHWRPIPPTQTPAVFTDLAAAVEGVG